MNIPAARAMARLRAFRTNLLPLHQAVLDAERMRYEREYGAIGGAHEALRLVMQDPFFAWLRPLAALIVQMDERLADDTPVQAAEVQAFREQARGLLQHVLGGNSFREHYQRTLQASPDVVIAHGRVMAVLAEEGDSR